MKKVIIFIVLIFVIVFGFSLRDGYIMHKAEQEKIIANNKNMQEEVKKVENFDGKYEIDTDASKVVWIGKKKIVKDWIDKGTIEVKSGEVEINASQSDFSNTTGRIVFDMTTIKSSKTGTKEDSGGSDKLNTHLKSADFFDVAKYNESSFVLKQVLKKDDGSYDLKGDLTIKGVTKEVELASIKELDFVIGGEGRAIEAKGVVKFNRADFNVRYGSDSFFDNLGDKIIEDEVTLELTLVAVKK